MYHAYVDVLRNDPMPVSKLAILAGRREYTGTRSFAELF
jgi:hypothetical protein